MVKGKQSKLHFPSDYYLPKDETGFYQFCYVDGAGQVRGASTPFCFRKSTQQNTETFLDDNLLIVITQVSDRTDRSITKMFLFGTSVVEMTMDTDPVKGQYS